MLMCVGVKERKSEKECLGLAAQTSGVLDYPHEVECNLDTSKLEGQRIIDVKCKCPAGNSGQCKHSVALLVFKQS
ncbi:hypothetical protein evm_009942 [Chilo suppressalis]|nr:hypothetical protein evm_009942 [Chilo suppressalis]